MNKRENIPKATEELEKIVSNENEDNKFERILKLEEKYPDDVGILQVISRNYLAVGDNTKALNYLLKAKSIEPNNFSIHYNLGTLHQTFKKDDDALEFFKKSIELNKDFINGYNALADLYLKKKNYKETIKYLKASVKIDFSINNINAISTLALSIVANYFQTKNLIELKDALIYFKKAHELDPSNDKILKQLISFYHLVGMKNEAVYLSKERTGVFEI
tara:strand:+ start:335 stop:991 length:657 start_codon:yes stop_codon:yes gene_type:complete